MILAGPGNASCDNKAAMSISELIIIIFHAVQQTCTEHLGLNMVDLQCQKQNINGGTGSTE